MCERKGGRVCELRGEGEGERGEGEGGREGKGVVVEGCERESVDALPLAR